MLGISEQCKKKSQIPDFFSFFGEFPTFSRLCTIRASVDVFKLLHGNIKIIRTMNTFHVLFFIS